MLEGKWLTQQGVIEKVDLADGKVVGSPPIGVDFAQFVGRERAPAEYWWRSQQASFSGDSSFLRNTTDFQNVTAVLQGCGGTVLDSNRHSP
jgi:hypothetical protein